MGREVFELAILLSLKDLASGRANQAEAHLRSLGKESRATLKTFGDLRKDFGQGLVMGGAGLAGLQLLRGGVKSAGDFEAAMADLRLSIEETGRDGKVNLAKLGDEMNRFEKLGMDLGNSLPGTTQDFVEMFSTLKQGGLNVETILAGTGKAVAHLAVVTGQVPKQLAEPFAQYVQQFHLTGEEATKLSNVLAKLKFTTGLNPQELIEGSKFFQLRAGSVLGMTGLEGAEQSGRLLATLRRSGLEGGIGGRELAGMFAEMTFAKKEQRKMLAELKGQGINLEFFDQKGSFKGIDNVFVQMEKLRKLSTKQRFETLGVLFGKEAAGPANIMSEAGLDGWKKTNAEIDRGSSLQDKINEKVGTYNAKLEAVLGTMENLKATTFTPLLDTLKPFADTANEALGALQGFAKEHQGLMGVATRLLGFGTAAVAVVGGIRAMRAGWALWKIASAIGSGEAGLLTFLRTARTETYATGAAMRSQGVVATGYRSKLGAIMPFIKTTVLLYGVEYALDRINAIRTEYAKLQEALGEEKASQTAAYKSFEGLAAEFAKQGKAVPQSVIDAAASGALASLNKEGEVQKTFDKKKFAGTFRYLPIPEWLGGAAKPFGNAFGDLSITTAAKSIKEKAPQLADPAVAEAFLKKLRSGAYGLSPEALKTFEQAVQFAFPDAIAQAQKAILEDAAAQKSSAEALTSQFIPGVKRAAKVLNRIGGGEPVAGGTIPVPSNAVGGYVQRGGFVHIHAGETIVPASVSQPYRAPQIDAMSGGGKAGGYGGSEGGFNNTGGIHLHVHPPAGSAMANDPEAFGKAALEHVTHAVRKQRERR